MTADLSIIFAMQTVIKFTTFFSLNNKVNSNIKILLIQLTNKMFSIFAETDESTGKVFNIFSKLFFSSIINYLILFQLFHPQFWIKIF